LAAFLLRVRALAELACIISGHGSPPFLH
jgi:hypothetical protein